MHPRQASLVVEAKAVLARFSGKTAAAPSGPVVLWKYEDPDGSKFYLEVKKTTVKSPFSGKSFSARPERYTPAQVGKEIKDERQAKNAQDLVEYMNRLAVGQTVLWQYTDPSGNLFWLDRKIVTSIRSPYGGPAFTPKKPKKVLPAQIGKILRDDGESEPPDPRVTDEPKDLQAFAARVVAIAKSPQTKKFHDDRVFISSVKDLGFPHMPRPKFDAMLVEAHQSGLLRLTRADLVGAMDPALVESSEVRYHGTSFHFVAIDAPRW